MALDNSIQKRRQFLKAASGIPAAFLLAGCQTGDEDPDDTNDGNQGTDNSGDQASQNAGEPVEFRLDSTNFSNYEEEMRFFKRQWEENLGLTVDYQVRSWDTYLGAIYGEPFDYGHAAQAGTGAAPDRIDPQYHLSLYESDSPQNTFKFDNEEFDSLYNEFLGTYEFEPRNELVTQMQEILVEERPGLTYIHPPAVQPYNAELWDIEPTMFAGIGATATRTIIDAEPKTDTDTLVMGSTGEFDAPNPLSSQSIGPNYLFKLVYDPIRMYNTDGEIENWVIDEFNPVDRTTLELTLREDMDFHDGEPVTAEDLAFTMGFFRDNTFPKFNAYAEYIEEATAQTDLTVELTLSEPVSSFSTSGLSMLQLLPKHIWESVPDEVDNPTNWNASVEDMVGSGPFEVSNVSSEQLIFEANDSHFNAPAYSRFVWNSYGGYGAIRAAFEQGDVHLPNASTPRDIAEGIAEHDSVELATIPQVLTQKIAFDTDKSPTDNPAFREALVKAVDIEEFRNVYHDGGGAIGSGTPIHPDLDYGSDDLPTLPEIYDPEEARSILEEEGYSWDDDGTLLHPN